MTTERHLLMIPGPIELEPAVLRALGEKPRSHVDPVFIKIFSRVLKQLRGVFMAPTGQPFVIAGSGTLAMEMAVANVIESGDRAVVVNTGYFSDRIAKMLERHGATVTQVKAAPGDVPTLTQVEQALTGGVKVLTITHVDTSTGVLAPVKELAALGRKHGALVIVDGVCSIGGEALEMDTWGVDVAFTASQKALGAPPGLAVLMVGPRAMAAFKARKSPVASVYCDFAEWLPIHEAYEAEKAAYFATPAVNLVTALDASLALIVAETMPARLERHLRVAETMNSGWARLGFETLPRRPELRAHTLSALLYPKGIDASLVKAIADEGVTVAGGLHPDLKTTYFRVGHMGAVSKNDLSATLGAIERSLTRLRG